MGAGICTLAGARGAGHMSYVRAVGNQHHVMASLASWQHVTPWPACGQKPCVQRDRKLFIC